MAFYNDLCDDWIYPADSNGNLPLTASNGDQFGSPPALPEGVYTFTITACGLDGQTQTTTFTWTLDYICTNLVCPTISPITYTIEGS